ncbi:ROK family protein [Clostridium sp. DL1XJH146]
MNRDNVIGIDLGGTKISGVISDLQGNVYSKYTIPTNAEQGEKVVLERIESVIDRLIVESEINIKNIKAIGIGSPGPLDPQKGIILTTPNLPFRNFKIVEPIEEKYGVKTFLDNDANVATIGEFMFGAGVSTENMLYVTVSTGIGGGAIINGKIYRGNTYNAFEVGHMTIEKDGPRCNCGNIGCAEVLSSGTAIARIANETISGPIIQSTLKKYDKVTAKEVFDEAFNGDKVAKEIIDTSLNYLGIFISNLIVTMDPEMIVIGGGVAQAGDIVFDKVKEVVDKRVFKNMAENCKIVPAKLGVDAGVIGAAALAIMECK